MTEPLQVGTRPNMDKSTLRSQTALVPPSSSSPSTSTTTMKGSLLTRLASKISKSAKTSHSSSSSNNGSPSATSAAKRADALRARGLLPASGQTASTSSPRPQPSQQRPASDKTKPPKAGEEDRKALGSWKFPHSNSSSVDEEVRVAASHVDLLDDDRPHEGLSDPIQLEPCNVALPPSPDPSAASEDVKNVVANLLAEPVASQEDALHATDDVAPLLSTISEPQVSDDEPRELAPDSCVSIPPTTSATLISISTEVEPEPEAEHAPDALESVLDLLPELSQAQTTTLPTTAETETETPDTSHAHTVPTPDPQPHDDGVDVPATTATETLPSETLVDTTVSDSDSLVDALHTPAPVFQALPEEDIEVEETPKDDVQDTKEVVHVVPDEKQDVALPVESVSEAPLLLTVTDVVDTQPTTQDGPISPPPEPASTTGDADLGTELAPQVAQLPLVEPSSIPDANVEGENEVQVQVEPTSGHLPGTENDGENVNAKEGGEPISDDLAFIMALAPLDASFSLSLALPDEVAPEKNEEVVESAEKAKEEVVENGDEDDAFDLPPIPESMLLIVETPTTPTPTPTASESKVSFPATAVDSTPGKKKIGKRMTIKKSLSLFGRKSSKTELGTKAAPAAIRIQTSQAPPTTTAVNSSSPTTTTGGSPTMTNATWSPTTPLNLAIPPTPTLPPSPPQQSATLRTRKSSPTLGTFRKSVRVVGFGLGLGKDKRVVKEIRGDESALPSLVKSGVLRVDENEDKAEKEETILPAIEHKKKRSISSSFRSASPLPQRNQGGQGQGQRMRASSIPVLSQFRGNSTPSPPPGDETPPLPGNPKSGRPTHHARVRTPLSPTLHSRGSIVLEMEKVRQNSLGGEKGGLGGVEEEEAVRMTEMAFMI